MHGRVPLSLQIGASPTFSRGDVHWASDVPANSDGLTANSRCSPVVDQTARGIAVGSPSLFACSGRSGRCTAAIYNLIGTAQLNNIDLQSCLSDVLGRIAETPQPRLHEFLSWHWNAQRQISLAA